MHCPFCQAPDTKVIDSRLVAEGEQVRRRRECAVCNERFTTFESAELVTPRVIKSSGNREPFDEDKLRRSMMHALQKRPVSIEQIDTAVQHILHRLRVGLDERVVTRLLPEVDARFCDRQIFRRLGRQIANEQHRQTFGRNLIDRSEREAVAMREAQAIVDPRLVRQTVGVQLAS